jgi:anti-sigma B factor antagonist
MNVTIAHFTDYTRISISGDLDANSSVQADEAFQKLLSDGVHKVHIDMSDLNYISSAGIGVFLSHQDEVQQKGGLIVFSGMNPRVQNVFQLLGLNAIFTIVPDIDAAHTLFTKHS